jgi:hypothetical protein
MAKRGNTDKCLLCKERAADKTGSHIITSFLTKNIITFKKPDSYGGILYIDDNRQGFELKGFLSQSTTKEDFIFCKNCEKRFEIIETYISNKFYQRYQNPEFSKDFPLSSMRFGNKYFTFLTSLSVNPELFSLFAWIQLYRASISSAEEFKHLNLNEGMKEGIRIHLNEFLKSTQVETINYCERHKGIFNLMVFGITIHAEPLNNSKIFVGAMQSIGGRAFGVFAGNTIFSYYTPYFFQNNTIGYGYNNTERPTEVILMNENEWNLYHKKLAFPFDFEAVSKSK